MAEVSALQAALDWWLSIGVDELVSDEPLDRFAHAATMQSTARTGPGPSSAASDPVRADPRAERGETAQPTRVPTGLAAHLGEAETVAAAAGTLEALRQAVETFEHCALRHTATRTVFCDGNPASGLMLLGEAPGAEEDRRGLPFVGASGQLLDRMLGAIGIDRTGAYISNAVFWRPPGNRPPTEHELALCRPFVWRHIALVRPKILVLVGGVATRALIPESPGIMRARGRWMALPVPGLAEPVQAMAMYHPSFLLRSPERKRDSWVDLLSIRSKLKKKTVISE